MMFPMAGRDAVSVFMTITKLEKYFILRSVLKPRIALKTLKIRNNLKIWAFTWTISCKYICKNDDRIDKTTIVKSK